MPLAANSDIDNDRLIMQGLWAVAALVIELDSKKERVTINALRKSMKAGAEISFSPPVTQVPLFAQEPLEGTVRHMPWVRDRLKPLMIVDVVKNAAKLESKRLDSLGRRVHSFATFETVCDELVVRARERNKRSAVVARLDNSGSDSRVSLLLCFLFNGEAFMFSRSADSDEWHFSYNLNTIRQELKLAGRGVGAVAQACM